MKNQLTPAGIEPATFRIVAQHFNHCATAVPQIQLSVKCILHLLVICCKYMENARYTQWQDYFNYFDCS